MRANRHGNVFRHGRNSEVVMPGLVPGIHVFTAYPRKKDVHDRDKPGHDRANPQNRNYFETAKASSKPAWRIVLARNAVIVGSRWSRSAGAFLMGSTMRQRHGSDCDVRHSGRIEPIPAWRLNCAMKRRGRITSRNKARVGAALTTISH